MIRKLDKIAKAVFVVILLLTVWLVIYSAVSPAGVNQEAYIGSFSVNTLNEGWTLVRADGSVVEDVTLPRDEPMAEGKAVLLRGTLPADIRDGMRLCVRSQRQALRVFINGEERGSYLAQNVSAGRKVLPSAFLLVDLRGGDALGTIELQFVPAAAELVRLREVTYGDGNNVWFPYIARNAARAIVAVLLAFMGLMAAVAYLVCRKRLHSAKSVLYLAEAMVVAGLWMLGESEIRQLVFRSPSLSGVFSFLLIEIMPAFLLMYFNELQERRYETGYVSLGVCSLILLLVNSALNAARIVAFYQSVRYFHILSGAMILYVLWTMAQDIRAKLLRRYRITAFGILLLTGTLIMEIVNFYSAGSVIGFGAFLGFGLMLLLGSTALQVISNELALLEEKRAAEAANRAKSTFLASMSHEIRTPINAILGTDELILRESGESETVARAADIRDAGRTLLSLINDILDFSRIEEGRMEILSARYELDAVLGDLVNMTCIRAEDKGLRLNVKVAENTPRVLFGDEVRIRQCALNLLTNAVKYTKVGVITLEVGFEPIDGESILLCFRVSDTGIGMKKEDMEKLFTPFARIEELRNRSIEGTGLGLSITQRLLALMGSTLEVKSDYGVGSTFSFALRQPVVDWTPIGKFTGHRASGAASGSEYRELFHAPDARVLVVDDMPVNLSVIRGLLKKTQLRLDTASSGEEALALAAETHYDVMLIDHMMPGMDGVTALGELKKLPGAESTAYIALTANALSGARERYIKAGFNDYLSKPVDGVRLEETLLRCLPPEKIAAPDSGDAEAPASAPPELPEALFRVDGLDVPAGIRYCGTTESYLETLAIYAKGAASTAEELESLRRAGDAAGLTVKVHALKSASRVIGAESLGALAEKLEAAGKAGDSQSLTGGLDELLVRFRALWTQLAAALPEPAAAQPLPLLTQKELRDTYDALRELVESMDFDSITFVAERLAKHRFPEEERERCEKICRAAENFDWDEIGGLLP
ncbi:MAG: response regulator [Oscillospiraceae bacterium]|nr:response regulator [Oscillospiraceae bacterium]